MTAAAIYCRISHDPTGLGLGVERQEAECRALCASLGFDVSEVYVDNDLSATSGKTRPAFERMLAARPPVIVAWHQDRLLRLTRDLERVISLDVPVHTVSAGTLDLTNPAGRAVARTVAAWSQYETEQKGTRQRAANRQRAMSGAPDWRTRPLGFEFDGSHRQAEADAIRDGAQMLLEGASLAAVGRLWTSREVLPPRAASWSLPAVRKVYTAARLAGLRTYRGEVIGTASWAPILDVSTWEAVVSILTNPARKTNPGDSKVRHLLSGLAMCSKCGAQVFSNWQKDRHGVSRRSYRCRPTAHLQRLAEPVEAEVIRRTVRVLVMPGAEAALTGTAGVDAGLLTERATLEHRRSEWLTSGMSPRDVATALAPIDARLAEINARLVDAQRAEVFGDWWASRGDLDAVPVERFAALPLHQQRAMLRAIWERIEVGGELTPTPHTWEIVNAADAIANATLTDVRDTVETLRHTVRDIKAARTVDA